MAVVVSTSTSWPRDAKPAAASAITASEPQVPRGRSEALRTPTSQAQAATLSSAMADRLTVALDATPLAGERTGDGALCLELLRELARRPGLDVGAFAL